MNKKYFFMIIFIMLFSLSFTTNSTDLLQGVETNINFTSIGLGDWRIISLLAAMISVLLIGIAYMFAEPFNLPSLKAWANEELAQAFVTVIILASVISVLSIVDAAIYEQVTYSKVSPFTCNTNLNIPCTIQVSNQYLNGLIDMAKAGGRESFLKAVEVMKKQGQGSTMSCGSLLNPPCLFYYSTKRTNAYILLDYDRYAQEGEIYNSIIYSLQVQRFFANHAANIVGPFLLVLGIIGRNFFATRRLGGLLMAIGLGLFIVFPAMYVWNAMTLNIGFYGDDILTDKTNCPAACQKGPPIAYDSNGPVYFASELSFIKQITPQSTNQERKEADDKFNNLLIGLQQIVDGYYSCEYAGSHTGINIDGKNINCPKECREMPYPYYNSICADNKTELACNHVPKGCKLIRNSTYEGCNYSQYEKLSYPQYSKGVYRIYLQFDSRKRFYDIYIPQNYNEKKATAAVLVFHGGLGNPEQQRYDSQMDSVADKYGFVVIYPAGTGKIYDDKFLTFNAGTCCGYARDNNIDDVGFTNTLLNDVETRFNIDKNRIYASGFSNGAFMTYRLAMELSNRIAAFAPVSGVFGVDPYSYNLDKSVPIIHFHGKKDEFVVYEGGIGPESLEQISWPSVNEAIQYWVNHNGCFITPEITQIGAAVSSRYSSCKEGTEVILWTLEDGGHTWPGGKSTLPENKVGKINMDIFASELMWKFFEKHPKGTADNNSCPEFCRIIPPLTGINWSDDASKCDVCVNAPWNCRVAIRNDAENMPNGGLEWRPEQCLNPESGDIHIATRACNATMNANTTCTWVVPKPINEYACNDCINATSSACLHSPPIITECIEECGENSESNPLRIGPAEFAKKSQNWMLGREDIKNVASMLVPAYLLPLLSIAVTLIFIRTFSPIFGGDIEIPGWTKVL